jgi:hypothetical protein
VVVVTPTIGLRQSPGTVRGFFFRGLRALVGGEHLAAELLERVHEARLLAVVGGAALARRSRDTTLLQSGVISHAPSSLGIRSSAMQIEIEYCGR